MNNSSIYDVINKKKHGYPLTRDEIHFAVEEYSEGRMPDYQMSALLMAICIRGMNTEEVASLTEAMAHSGRMVCLSEFENLSVDKHSTGGVGDKTTLIVAPLVAAVGCKVAKMSGRGLGHTGGTIDKLEAIPGFSTSLSESEFIEQVKEIGVAVIGQSEGIAPADKKIYALRDVSATVDSIPLIASSVMSKKLASGAKNIVLDVKCGSGAFMKTEEDARALARAMIDIGEAHGRKVSALITSMQQPLGYAIGNAIEVSESIDVLCGGGPEDLRLVSLELASLMTAAALGYTPDEAMSICENALNSGAALEKFKEWISHQGGDVSVVENRSVMQSPKYSHAILSKKDGFIGSINAEGIGLCAVELGAGRLKKEDKIDYSAGIMLSKKVGDKVKAGELIATLYSSTVTDFSSAEKRMLDSIEFSDVKVAPDRTVIARIYKGIC